MPNWWPSGRSARPDPTPAVRAPRSEPAWHRLPAVQRTVADLETTAHLHGFTASLTTSQNPGFICPLDLLAAEHVDQLPVLGGVTATSGTATPPASAAAAPARRSQTWGPSPMAVQRALRESTETVQRTANVGVPVRQIHPVAAVRLPDDAPRSMVDAPPPDDRRVLAAATVSGPDDSVTARPSPGPDNSSTGSAAEASVSPVAQRTPSTTPLDTAAQAVSARPAGAPGNAGDHPAPPLRRLPVVAQAGNQSTGTAHGFTGGRAVTVLRTVDSPNRPAPLGTNKPDGAPLAPIGTAAPTPVTETATTHLPATTPSTPVDSAGSLVGALPVARTDQTPEPPAVPPAQTMQRIAVVDHRAEPVPDRRPVPQAPVTPSPLARLQRLLPVFDARPPAPVAGAGFERQDAPSSTVQRMPELPAETVPNVRDHTGGVPADPDRPNHPPAVTASETIWASTALGSADMITAFSAASTDARSPTAATPSPTAGVLQRTTLPVVRPNAAPAPEPIHATFSSSQRYSVAPKPPEVQRAAAGGRLAVLPPVRTSSGGRQTPSDHAAQPDRSVLFQSPHPVGLQRMFDHAAERTDSAAGFRAAITGYPASTPNAPGPGDGHTETTGAGYDPSTNTITFTSPVVQRQADTVAPAVEPAPTPTPDQTATAAPTAPRLTAGGDVDELVSRLYDPLVARLRAELWLDRERAGVLMDLGR